MAAVLDDVQQSLFDAALARREARTVEVGTVEEAIAAAATGFARIPWAAVGEEGETTLNDKGVSIRCLQREDGGLPTDRDEPGIVAFVGRAY